MTSVRLDPDTEARLSRLAEGRGQTKSDVIRDAIDHLAERELSGDSASGKLRAYAGIVDSGGRQLSTRTGERLRELLEKRRSASSPG